MLLLMIGLKMSRKAVPEEEGTWRSKNTAWLIRDLGNPEEQRRMQSG